MSFDKSAYVRAQLGHGHKTVGGYHARHLTFQKTTTPIKANSRWGAAGVCGSLMVGEQIYDIPGGVTLFVLASTLVCWRLPADPLDTSPIVYII